MLNASSREIFKKLVSETTEERDKVRTLIKEGKWKEAEKDDSRRALYALKHRIRQKTTGAESITGDTMDWVDVNFFSEGNTLKRAVAYVTVNINGVSTSGTGFMVSERLFMTNNHVIGTIEEARMAVITFNKENDEFGKPLPTTKYRLDPDTFFEFSPQDQLDYSIIAIGSREFGDFNAADAGFFILSDAPDKHVVGMNVNIIQHPLDLPKKVTFRNNPLVVRTDNALLYETDTENCSSGSPVCNDFWDLVVIHHWGEPYQAKRDNPDSELPIAVNEGIRISCIYKDLSVKLEQLADTKGKELLYTALSYAKSQPSVFSKAPGPRPISTINTGKKSESELKEEVNAGNSEIKTNAMSNNEIKLIIPLEVSIKVGSNFNAIGQAVEGNEPRVLIDRSEANKIDRNYSNRSGYVADFIPGVTLPLPKIEDTGNIAPLKEGQPERSKGVLKYEHFSIVMNAGKRCAFFSATNIDGKSYKRINRETGTITPRSRMDRGEGETWYGDDRIDEKYHITQPFFSEWSHYFDRGHLTRRTDPSWGSDTVALRADADTFHFTNCAIQHFRFNQTIPYWQGAERYILENGFLEADADNRLVVYQGPIYNDKVDLWADDFQIPSKFFKIAVWKYGEELKSVGLIVDQSSLLSEERKKLGQPKEVKSVDVSAWRVPITEIQELAKLDFGRAVREADTIGQEAQPNVGAESFTKRQIGSFADIIK